MPASRLDPQEPGPVEPLRIWRQVKDAARMMAVRGNAIALNAPRIKGLRETGRL